MPYLAKSSYRPKFIFKNGHFSTIYSGVIKKFLPPSYSRKKLSLPDGDFINLDFKIINSRRAVILCHGLEGDSRRVYNNSCADFFLKKDYSVFAWNNRSCGGEMNLLPQLYHHASVDDLEFVVNYVLEQGFEEVYLIGFSLGAAQILNLFSRKKLDEKVIAGVSVSAPIQLKSSAEKLKKGFNRVYLNRFIRKIKVKIEAKAQMFPEIVNTDFVPTIKTFDEIDEHFTAPLHGFKSGKEYYQKASPAYSLENVSKPVLIINAWDDPFLGEGCYPIELAKKHPFIYLETPKYGGHCAFPMRNSVYSWTDFRAYEFFNKDIISEGFGAAKTALPATKTSAPN